MKLTLADITLRLAFPLIALVCLTGCNGLIYDDEGDCDPYYKVKFVYDTNLKFTDAFATEVSEVTLYVVDPSTGEIVWQRHEEGDILRSGNYMMDVDVEPGNYDLIAWCGEGHTSSFTVADANERVGLRCMLTDREAASEGEAHVRNELRRLFHGKSENVEFEDEQGVHVKTVRLIKDTNDLHIMLQHLSGEDVDHRDFTMTVTGTNGHMDWDNSLLPDDKLTYFAHSIYSGTAGVEVPDYTKPEGEEGRAITQVSAAVGHLSLSRLMVDDDLYVKIHNKEGEQIVSVPLSEYALLVRGKYKHPDGTELTPQEYLDYQDDYSMVFFLDENGRWSKTHIYINSWRVVLQNTDL